MNDFQKKAQWYFALRFEFSGLTELKKQGPACPRDKFISWSCCPIHRALNRLNETLNDLGDELNDTYGLGGISHAYFKASLRDEDVSQFHHSPRAPHVGSQAWLTELSIVSGVPLPDEKSGWWIKSPQ